jgi:hypothetical protein
MRRFRYRVTVMPVSSVAATMSKPPSLHALPGHAAGTEIGRHMRILDAVMIATADQLATTAHGYMVEDTRSAPHSARRLHLPHARSPWRTAFPAVHARPQRE